jgi:hypothetical protein
MLSNREHDDMMFPPRRRKLRLVNAVAVAKYSTYDAILQPCCTVHDRV